MSDSQKSNTPAEGIDEYQHLWDKFIDNKPASPVALLPLEIGLDAKGEIFRRRMKADDVAEIWKNIKTKFPHYMYKEPSLFDDPKRIFEDYINFFKKYDSEEISPPRSPLDILIRKPTWLLYSLGNPNWKFAKTGAQFSTENDADDQTRNFVKIATFNDDRLPPTWSEYGQPLNERKLFILSNRNRCAPTNLKFNLHVDVLQKTIRGYDSTTIIIDPGSKNFPNPPFP